jgi:hypothetical protein
MDAKGFLYFFGIDDVYQSPTTPLLRLGVSFASSDAGRIGNSK